MRVIHETLNNTFEIIYIVFTLPPQTESGGLEIVEHTKSDRRTRIRGRRNRKRRNLLDIERSLRVGNLGICGDLRYEVFWFPRRKEIL